MVQREAWRDIVLASHRGWGYTKNKLIAAALTLYSWVFATLVYAAVSGTFTVEIAAQSPVHIDAAGVDYILWIIIAGMVTILMGIVKSWIIKQATATAANTEAIARIDSKLNRLLGIDEGEDRAARLFRSEFGTGRHRVAGGDED
jgi:hypothetical protein